MQVAIELPNDIVEFQSIEIVKQDLALAYAMLLYKKGKITLSKGAHLAGLNLMSFMQFCSINGVAVIDDTEEDFLSEIAMINTL
jgi:predicted HTH domain antitoxin